MLRSAGIIVFNKNKVLLVTDVNHFYSFPKGHKYKHEFDLDTAWRELYEETGLLKKNVMLIHKNKHPVYFTEIINKNEYNKYYVGNLMKETNNFKFDQTEIIHVDFYNIYEAFELNNFNEQRKNIMSYAYKLNE